eukprot:1578625-Alexandrium_andersonii.AAC.1
MKGCFCYKHEPQSAAELRQTAGCGNSCGNAAANVAETVCSKVAANAAPNVASTLRQEAAQLQKH